MLLKLFSSEQTAQLAQLVEQRTENPRVSGSIPELGSMRVWFNGRTSAFQAENVGSIPITRLCDSGVVGNARPCQGRDRGFEPRLSLSYLDLQSLDFTGVAGLLFYSDYDNFWLPLVTILVTDLRPSLQFLNLFQ